MQRNISILCTLAVTLLLAMPGVCQTTGNPTTPAPAKRTLRETVSWSEAQGRLDGKRVHVGLADASVISGKVVEITAEEIKIAQSSRSQKVIRRADIKFFQYDEFKGKSRARWATGLAVGAAAWYVFLVMRAKDSGDSLPPVFIPVMTALGAGGAAGGYAIGRQRDRQTVVLTISTLAKNI